MSESPVPVSNDRPQMASFRNDQEISVSGSGQCLTQQERMIRSKSVHFPITTEVCEVSSNVSEINSLEGNASRTHASDPYPDRAHVSDGYICKETSTSFEKASWQPKWNRLGPLLGLVALILSALSIPVAFGILRASDGKIVDSWTYSPSVYLAIITSITGKALALAALQGAVISWWLRAIRGSTIEQLHRDWQMGQNIWDALLAGRRINMIAIACICAAIAAIDAPLLQRSSSVVSATPNTNVSLDISLVPELPAYYTGAGLYPIRNATRKSIYGDINIDYMPIVTQWMRKDSLPSIAKGCPGSCSTTIQAPMIATWNCTWTPKHVNLNEPLPGNLTWQQAQADPDAKDNRTAFGAVFTLDPSGWPNIEREFVALTIPMADEQIRETCIGNITKRDCLLASAIGEYDIIVEGNNTRYKQGLAQPRFVAWANNTAVTAEAVQKYNLSQSNLIQDRDYENGFNTTLGGFSMATFFKYNKAVTFVTEGGSSNNALITGIDDWVLSNIVEGTFGSKYDGCIPKWKDPFDKILSDANDLMFRTAIHLSRHEFRKDLLSETYTHLDPGIADSIDYTIEGKLISPTNVFSVDYPFFWGASIVELICIGVITYTYIGWWRLGRAFSFSPLELAKAFRSPMFDGVNSNTESDKMSKELGARKVKYGIIGMEADSLAFADADQVQNPVRGALFSR